MSTQRRTVLGSQPVRAASRSCDRFRAAWAVRSSCGVRTGKETSGVGTVLGVGPVLGVGTGSVIAQAPTAKASKTQNVTKAIAAIRSKRARAASNIG